MADDHVLVIGPYGEKGTVAPADVPAVLARQGRVATPQEIAEHELEANYAKASTISKVGGALIGAGALPPTIDAYSTAATDTLTGGVHKAIVRQAADAIKPGSGAAYEQHVEDLATGKPGATTAGHVAGIAGQMAIATQIPVPGMAALEGAVGRGLAGVAARGAVGKAVTTGAQLAARGAVETAAYSAVQSAAEDKFHDNPIDGEKLAIASGHGFLMGGGLSFGLGAAGSLAASGARGAYRAGANALMQRITRAAERSEAEAASSAARGIAEEAPVALKPGRKLLGQGEALERRPSISGDGVTEGPAARATKTSAHAEEMAGEVVPKAAEPAPSVATQAEAKARRVANDFAYDSLSAKPNVTDKINGRVQGGANAVGDWMNRNIYKGTDPQSTFSTMIGKSRADEALPLIESKLSEIGTSIRAEVQQYPTRVDVRDVIRPSADIHDRMLGSVTERQGADAFYQRIKQMADAWDHAGKVRGDGTMSLSDLYSARAEMEGVAHELGKGTAGHTAFKEYLRKLDGMLVDKLAESAAQAGDQASKARILHLKREYHLGAAARQAAESGAKRISANNKFSLRDTGMAMAGIASGHGLAAVGLAIGSKLLRERGDAMAAWMLSRAADRGVIRKAVQAVDDQVSKSARGVLRESGAEARAKLPDARPEPRRTYKTRADAGQTREAGRERQQAKITQGQAIVKWVAESRTNPDRVMEQVAQAAATVGEHGGKQTAGRFTTTTLRALNFVSAYVPVKERRDPLDPRSTPPLTYEEADRLVRAANYAQRPMSVFEDFERGKVTPEGLRAAKEFMPDTFEQFQQELLEVTTDQILRNKRLTQTQRLRLDKLGIVSIKPETIAHLQASFDEVPAEPPPAPGGSPPTGGPPLGMKVQQTGFDRIEARATG